jgi:hypothetical protein
MRCRSRALPATLVIALLSAGPPGTASAADHSLRGEAPLRAPSAEAIAALPTDAPLSADDLRSGRLTFDIVYDDQARDTDPDRHVGRYPVAIRSFRVRIGGTSFDLPPQRSEFRVSDGGVGMHHRESLLVHGSLPHGRYLLQAGWIQLNQRSPDTDLRGSAGALAGDGLPGPDAMLGFAASSPFDRVFYLRLDPLSAGDAGTPARPLLYLSTSSLTVTRAQEPGR